MGLLTIKFTILDVFLRLGRCELIVSNDLYNPRTKDANVFGIWACSNHFI